MIMQRKDFRSGMMIRLWNNHEYKVFEEIRVHDTERRISRLEQREQNKSTLVLEGQLTITNVLKVIDLKTKRVCNLSNVYYEIRCVWNSKQKKIIAKRKHPNAELKIE